MNSLCSSLFCRLGGEPAWAVCGESFPVGCRFDPGIHHHHLFSGNPDRRRRQYSSPLGIYFPGKYFTWFQASHPYLLISRSFLRWESAWRRRKVVLGMAMNALLPDQGEQSKDEDKDDLLYHVDNIIHYIQYMIHPLPHFLAATVLCWFSSQTVCCVWDLQLPARIK